jgi:hypothetical protein
LNYNALNRRVSNTSTSMKVGDSNTQGTTSVIVMYLSNNKDPLQPGISRMVCNGIELGILGICPSRHRDWPTTILRQILAKPLKLSIQRPTPRITFEFLGLLDIPIGKKLFVHILWAGKITRMFLYYANGEDCSSIAIHTALTNG